MYFIVSMIKALHKESMCCLPHDAFSTERNNICNFAQEEAQCKCTMHLSQSANFKNTLFFFSKCIKNDFL
jgi:hypothetical protein